MEFETVEHSGQSPEKFNIFKLLEKVLYEL